MTAPPPAAAPVRRQTLAALTLDAIRDRILRGEYPEGEPLRQDAIAEALGVSRIPVREALRQLEAEGLVTFHPHRGAVVSSLSLAEIDELFELRAHVEAELLRQAVPNSARADADRAAEILDGFAAALATGDVASWGALNWRFHAALYAPAARPFTLAVVQKLHQHADRYLRMQLALTHGESRADAEHHAILAAVRGGDAGGAAELLRAHILGAGRALHAFLSDRAARAT